MRDAGVFRGFAVSSSFRADFDFAVFFVLADVSFSRDFFAAFGLGVGVWRPFDFGETLGSGVSRGVGAGVAPSSPSDLRPGEPSLANFDLGTAVGAFSGVAEARGFFAGL
jgi:hypothetical protein